MSPTVLLELSKNKRPWLLLVFCWIYTRLLKLHGVFEQHGIFEALKILPCGSESCSPLFPLRLALWEGNLLYLVVELGSSKNLDVKAWSHGMKTDIMAHSPHFTEHISLNSLWTWNMILIIPRRQNVMRPQIAGKRNELATYVFLQTCCCCIFLWENTSRATSIRNENMNMYNARRRHSQQQRTLLHYCLYYRADEV